MAFWKKVITGEASPKPHTNPMRKGWDSTRKELQGVERRAVEWPCLQEFEEGEGWAQPGSRSEQHSSMALGGDELDKGGEEPGNQVAKANVKNAEIGAGEARNQEKLHGVKMRVREELWLSPQIRGEGPRVEEVSYSPFSTEMLLFPGQQLQTAAKTCWGTSPAWARDWAQHGFKLPWISGLNQAVTPHPTWSGASPQEQKTMKHFLKTQRTLSINKPCKHTATNSLAKWSHQPLLWYIPDIFLKTAYWTYCVCSLKHLKVTTITTEIIITRLMCSEPLYIFYMVIWISGLQRPGYPWFPWKYIYVI